MLRRVAQLRQLVSARVARQGFVAPKQGAVTPNTFTPNRPINPPTCRTEWHFAIDLNRTVTKGLALATMTGYGVSLLTGPVTMLPVMGVGMAGSLACLWQLRRQLKDSSYKALTPDEAERVETKFWWMCGGAGLMLTPVLALSGPFTGPLVAGALSAAAVGMSRLALTTRQNPILTWQEPALAGCCVMIAIELAGWASFLLFGNNATTQFLVHTDLLLGVSLYTALSAYTTHLAVDAYRENPHQHTVLLATGLLLSLINLMMRILDTIQHKMKQ